jgi:hypothetical protein
VNNISSPCAASGRLSPRRPLMRPILASLTLKRARLLKCGNLVRNSEVEGDQPMLGVDTDIAGIAMELSRFHDDAATPGVVRTGINWIGNGAI